MKRAFTRIWRITTWPFNQVIILLGKLIHGFLTVINRIFEYFTSEPSDVTTAEAVKNVFEDPKATLFHLAVFRKALIRWFIFLSITSMIAFYYYPQLFSILTSPFYSISTEQLRISGPGEFVEMVPAVALSAGFVLSLPYLLFEVWVYAAPGLMLKERIVSFLLVPFSLLVVILGFLLGYFLIIPNSLSFILSGTETLGMFDWELIKYISFVLKILGSVALTISMPAVVALVRIAKSPDYEFSFRMVILVCLIISAAVTPGTMIMIDLGLTILLALLYAINNSILKFVFSLKKQQSEP